MTKSVDSPDSHRPRWQSLTFKLSFLLLAIVMTATAAQTWRVLATFNVQWALRQEEMAAAALTRLGSSLGTSDEEHWLEGLNWGGHEAMRLFDSSGNALEWFGSREGQPEVPSERIGRFATNPVGSVKVLRRFGEGLAVARVLQAATGEKQVLLYTQAWRPQPLLKTLRELAIRNFLFSFALSALAALLLVRWLRRRLKNLGSGFQKVADGQLSTRLEAPPERELAQLVDSFNQMASRLEEARRFRELAERERQEFMAQASHELRTPLTSLQGYLESLTMDELELPPAQARRFLSRSYLECRELAHRIEDLVELVRLERPSFSLTAGSVSLAEIKTELERRYQPLAKSSGITLQGLEPDPEEEGLTGWWDRRRVVQILGNLLQNALKATPAGGRVRLEWRLQEERLRIELHDQGPGFEAGYKDPSGLGLGLQIAQRLVHAHQGRLGLEPSPEQPGSLAWVELPLKPS